MTNQTVGAGLALPEQAVERSRGLASASQFGLQRRGLTPEKSQGLKGN